MCFKEVSRRWNWACTTAQRYCSSQMVFKIGCAIPLLFISVLSDNFLHVSLSEQVCDSSKQRDWFWLDSWRRISGCFVQNSTFLVCSSWFLCSIWSIGSKMTLHKLVQPGCSTWHKEGASKSNIFCELPILAMGPLISLLYYLITNMFVIAAWAWILVFPVITTFKPSVS